MVKWDCNHFVWGKAPEKLDGVGGILIWFIIVHVWNFTDSIRCCVYLGHDTLKNMAKWPCLCQTAHKWHLVALPCHRFLSAWLEAKNGKPGIWRSCDAGTGSNPHENLSLHKRKSVGLSCVTDGRKCRIHVWTLSLLFVASASVLHGVRLWGHDPQIRIHNFKVTCRSK